MLLVDVNILVYAHRVEAPDHDRYRQWLTDAGRGPEPVGLLDSVLAGFCRIVTHPRIFREPSPLSNALEFITALRGAPAAVRVTPGDRVWSLFERVAVQASATGNLIPDAFLVATALEQGATLVTADRGFGRFREVTCLHPVE